MVRPGPYLVKSSGRVGVFNFFSCNNFAKSLSSFYLSGVVLSISTHRNVSGSPNIETYTIPKSLSYEISQNK